MGEAAQLFPVRRATRWESWSRDSNWGASVYQGDNPPDGAILDYFLAEEQPDGVTITITNADDEEVNTVRGSGRVGVNRSLWNMRWADPPGTVVSPFAAFFGGSGLPALPGNYTATLRVGDFEQSESFQLRGDPDVGLSLADYEAQFAVAMRVRDLTSTVNDLIRTVDDLTGQVEAVEGQLQASDIDNLEAIVEQTGTASAQLMELQDKLRRPIPNMMYRQFPRLSDELMMLTFGIVGAQARPTQGTYTAVEELDAEAQVRIQELNEIINTTIQELNHTARELPESDDKVVRGAAVGLNSHNLR